MKICWDNLEKLKYDKKKGRWGFFSFGKRARYFFYVESCKTCGEPFLSRGHNKKWGIGESCSKSCAQVGKIASGETRKKLSEMRSGEKHWMYGKHYSEFRKHPFIGKHHSEETKKKMREAKMGEKSPAWKGGLSLKNLCLFNTHAPQISWCEATRRDPEDEKILQVKCTYCGKWYRPTRTSTNVRIRELSERGQVGGRLYCSKECKNSCPIYYKSKYSAEETNTKQFSREVQPELRKMVFERDNWTCIKCNNTKELHCHHVEGIRWEPLESADMDKCVTLCENCHEEVHKIEGCKTFDMRCDSVP